MPRIPLTKLTSLDLPLDLDPKVEAVLEIDRLFWLDPKNTFQKQFERRFVPGEELPKKLPGPDKDGCIHTRVFVSRSGRTFLVHGIPTLMIEDNPPKDALKRDKKPLKNRKEVMHDFRKFMAAYVQQVVDEREKRHGRTPTVEERATQSAQDKIRMVERRAIQAQRRAETTDRKRNRKKTTQPGELDVASVEIPARAV